ncbi:MAG: hypothetical protein AB7F96_15185 [Beijerinckiaceae bacterium]
MCDYSLEMYASRPARAGEYYVTTRFPTGSLGITAPGDIKTAICVQCDTRLELENVPAILRREYALQATESVTFTRIDCGAYRDGVRFANGSEVSLQLLGPGVKVWLSEPSLEISGREATPQAGRAGALEPV